MYLAQRFLQILAVLAVRNARKVLMGETGDEVRLDLGENPTPMGLTVESRP